MEKITVEKEGAKKRINLFVLENFSALTLQQINKAIKEGNIKVNGNKILKNYLLKEQDEIKIYLNFKKPNVDLNFLKATKTFKIFYEDKNIIIIDKDFNVKCQEDKTEKLNHLNNLIKKYLYLKKEWDPLKESDFVPNLCHRIDKETTGLVVAFKNQETMKELYLAFQNGWIDKYYTCLTYGKFKKPKGTLVSYIMKNEKAGRMEIDKKNLYNKKIITHFEVIDYHQFKSRVHVKIDTGKKHQIRVHLSSIGHPILGDLKYNSIENFGHSKLCLKASKIKFRFPKGNFLEYLNNKNFEIKNFEF